MLSNNAIWKSLTKKNRLFLIAGPCVIESEALCFKVARTMAKTCAKLGVTYIFKASFDKANRSSGKSFRGPGLDEGLAVLAKIRFELGLPILTDVHTEGQISSAAREVDVLQIPAFLCRQTDLLVAAAASGKIVNVKKGQFLAPNDMAQVVKKVRESGGEKLLLTERGTTFGYNNLVVDMRGLSIMKQLGCPVVMDATHAVQLPGGAGDRSSGQREFAPVLAQAALAAGADGVFVETHPDPDNALSDGPNMIPLSDMPKHLARWVRVMEAARS